MVAITLSQAASSIASLKIRKGSTTSFARSSSKRTCLRSNAASARAEEIGLSRYKERV